MSLSINSEKLADLQKLTVFFDFIQNPQSYKEFLSETHDILENMEKIVNAYTTVEEAEQFLAEAEAKLQSAEEHSDQELKRIADEETKARQRIADEQAVAEQARSDIAQRKQEVAQMQLDLDAVKRNLEEREARVAQRETLVTNKLDQVNTQLQEIADKKAKLSALLGG